MTRLVSERLTLTPIDTPHVAALHHLWTDPEVRRYLWDDYIMSEDQVRDIVAQSRRCFDATGTGLFAMCLNEQSETIIGFCGLRMFEDDTVLELRYGILPNHWGGGLVTEAARAVLDDAFGRCGLQRVVAVTDTPNQRAVRVLQRLGMSFEKRTEFHGLDSMFYTLTEAEHRAAQPVQQP